MRLYEAMFVANSSRAREDLPAIQEEIREALTRHGAELVNCERWEERKLAYPIKRHKRGMFLLSHFHAPTDAIGRIERAFRLSETVLRMLITVDEDGTEIVSPRPDRDGDMGGYGRGPDSRRERRPRSERRRAERPRGGSNDGEASPSRSSDKPAESAAP